MITLGLSPNGITLLSLVLSLGLCAMLLATGRVVLFGILIVAAGLLDMVDGAAARISGNVTKFGGYLDALCDRLSEAAICFTVAQVSGEWAILFISHAGTYTVSYAKARAAMEIAINNDDWPDVMERTERGLSFALVLIVWGLYPEVRPMGHSLLYWGLVPIGGLVYVTLLQRLLRARSLMLAQAPVEVGAQSCEGSL